MYYSILSQPACVAGLFSACNKPFDLAANTASTLLCLIGPPFSSIHPPLDYIRLRRALSLTSSPGSNPPSGLVSITTCCTFYLWIHPACQHGGPLISYWPIQVCVKGRIIAKEWGAGAGGILNLDCTFFSHLGENCCWCFHISMQFKLGSICHYYRFIYRAKKCLPHSV